MADQSDLFVFSDAAKNEKAAPAVYDVRRVLTGIAGFKSVCVVERDQNLGLANSVTGGVSKLCSEYGRAIALEDDLVTAPNFLRYMNGALEKYAGNPRVYSVTGYSFSNHKKNIDSTYFLELTSSWGWATWADKWSVFERNKDALAEQLRSPIFRKQFNFGNSYDYVGLAEAQLAGKNDSWAIYWYFCVMQKHGLTLYPAKSLIDNIGFDGSGVHMDNSGKKFSLKEFEPKFTEFVSEKPELRKIVERALRASNPRRSLSSRIRDAIERRLKPS
jgi:hypothetical protein